MVRPETIKPGQHITIELLGERTRGQIASVVGPTAVIAELLNYTTGKEHGRHRGDLVACRQERDGFGIMVWRALKESELAQARPVEAPPDVSREIEPVSLAMG